MILLDGNLAAAALQEALLKKTEELRRHHIVPGLGIVRVGEDPASLVYVARKKRKATSLSFRVHELYFPETVCIKTLEQAIRGLNQSPHIHGILLQLPIPPHLNAADILNQIDPHKDVDGLHPLNQGLLFSGHAGGFIPCTPLGCLSLIQHFGLSVRGAHTVVVGRSTLVGRPLGALLLLHHATVTLAHSHTTHLAEITSRADFLFVAAGQPHLIKKHHVKPGACVVDVGINLRNGTDSPSSPRPEAPRQLIGDVDFEQVHGVAGALSPVPGGVGPMTVISLMQNTLQAACRFHGLPF